MTTKTTYLLLFLATLVLAPNVFASGIVVDFSQPGIQAGCAPGTDFASYFPPGCTVGTTITNQYDPLVDFTTANGINYVVDQSVFGTYPGAPTGGNYLAVNTTPVFGSPVAVLTATFNTDYSGDLISFYLADSNPIPNPRVIVQSFDSLGNLIETVDLTTVGATLHLTTGNVHSVKFFDNGGDGFVLDNLIVEPEPGTVLLMGTGLLVLGFVIRRKTS